MVGQCLRGPVQTRMATEMRTATGVALGGPGASSIRARRDPRLGLMSPAVRGGHRSGVAGQLINHCAPNRAAPPSRFRDHPLTKQSVSAQDLASEQTHTWEAVGLPAYAGVL